MAHPLVYLDKDNSSDGFQDQHDCHGEGVDAGIVLHVWIVLHAVTHRASIPLKYCGVLFGGKVPWGKIPETPRSWQTQRTYLLYIAALLPGVARDFSIL